MERLNLQQQQQTRQAPPPPPGDKDAVDGFVLYNMNIVDDSVGSEQYSAPSMLSPLSGFSSGASSSVLVRNGPGPRLPPPPQTGTLRTNFTTGASIPHGGAENAANVGMAGQPRRPGNDFTGSPDAGFRDMTTPMGRFHPIEADENVRPFLDIMALQEKIDKPSWISMAAVFVAIVLGLIVGSIIQHNDVSTTAAQWLMTPGNLYLRAVQCVVIPFVFVNMVVSTADLVHMRLGSRIAFRVFSLFFLVTVLALLQGMGMGYLFRELFNKDRKKLSDAASQTVFGIQCANNNYMEMQSNGSVACSATGLHNASEFIVTDIHGVLVKTSDTRDSTLTDNLIAIIDTIVPPNIMAAFVDVTMLSVVAFAIPVGATLAKSFHGPIHMNPLLEFLREVNETLVHMIQWVVKFTPYAVLSLMIGSFDVNLEGTPMENPLEFMYKISGMMAVGVLVHMLVVMPLLFFFFTGSSPFRFMRHLVPAYVSAIGNSSSMAALPMTLRCIEESRTVSNSVMYFVMSIGSNLNMAGTAMYLPFAVYVMVDAVGLASGLDTLDIVILLVGALLGTLSAAPIPAGAFTVITTVWGIVLPKYSVPPVVLALLLAADVMLDRLVTVCNVNGAALTCRIIGDQVDESLTDELMRVQRERRQQPFSMSQM